jgi:hypothetical protein
MSARLSRMMSSRKLKTAAVRCRSNALRCRSTHWPDGQPGAKVYQLCCLSHSTLIAVRKQLAVAISLREGVCGLGLRDASKAALLEIRARDHFELRIGLSVDAFCKLGFRQQL